MYHLNIIAHMDSLGVYLVDHIEYLVLQMPRWQIMYLHIHNRIPSDWYLDTYSGCPVSNYQS